MTSATDPNGNNLIGAAGWTFTIVSNTQFRINHPLGNIFVGAFTNGVNPANSLVTTRVFFGNSTGTYSMFQDVSYTQIDFYSMSSVNAGYASAGSGSVIINLMGLAA